MKSRGGKSTAEALREALSRRDFIAVSAAVGATLPTGTLPASAHEKRMKKSFTILHTNDMRLNIIGMGPASDYIPFTHNDVQTPRRRP